MWLAVTALLLAPHLRTALVPTTGSHPDGRVLADLGWPRPLWQWELAILEGFRIFREMRKHRGGTVTADLINHTIRFDAPT